MVDLEVVFENVKLVMKLVIIDVFVDSVVVLLFGKIVMDEVFGYIKFEI